MHKTALQRYTRMLQNGAWLQMDSTERKRKRWIMWKHPNGKIETEPLLTDDFRTLVSLLDLHRVEQSAQITRFVMRTEQS